MNNSNQVQLDKNPFEGWVTLEEAAETIGRDRSTVKYWADNGKIACYPLGRRVRAVYLQEVIEYNANPEKRKELWGKRKFDNNQ